MIDERLIDPLKTVMDPELGVNIIDLGLVYEAEIDDDGKAYVKMTLTTPGCPLHATMTGGVKAALYGLPFIKETEVDVVWEPAWTPSRMSDNAKNQLGYF